MLTARHCVDDDDHLRRWGVAAPARGDEGLPFSGGWLALYGVRVYEATRVMVHDGAVNGALDLFASRLLESRVEWVDDWGILALDSDARLAVMPLDDANPAVDLPPGALVSLLAYHDGAFVNRYRHPFLQSHEHPFAWTGVPPGVAQPGHSGAPIVHDGRVVAVLSGFVQDPPACRLLCGTWVQQLRLVNVASVRREAARRGLAL